MKKRLSTTDLRPGIKLPWPVYDQEGNLLLRKGYVLSNEEQICSLVARGLYFETSAVLVHEGIDMEPIKVTLNKRMHDLRNRLYQIFHQLIKLPNHTQPIEPRIRNFALDIRDLCHCDGDAAIAAVHLFLQDNYQLDHPMHAAFLVELLGKQAERPESERLSLICAALTHDIGIAHIQQLIDEQKGPLSHQQWERVKEHPLRSVAILEQHGIDDPVWLSAVRHHHERLDGTGYPDQLVGDANPIPARILAIADTYSAMVRPRAYRDAIGNRKTLQTLFLDRGAKVDAELTKLLVSTFSIYPPGTLLRLDNGEIALSVRRGSKASEPLIYNVITATGALLVEPKPVQVSQVKEVVPIQRFRSVLSIVEGFYCDIASHSRHRTAPEKATAA